MYFQSSLSLIFSLILFFGQTFALSPAQSILAPDSDPTSPGSFNVYTAYQFPSITWIENLAVRQNGKILVTLLNTPEVWEIDPFTQAAELIYHFPNVTGAGGIAEVSPYIFAVAVGNYSFETGISVLGSYSVWSIDVSGRKVKSHKITDIPGAEALNGMTVLPTQPHTVLVGDPGLGIVWHVETKTGAYRVAIDIPEFKPNTSAILDIGVNGIHCRDGYLYFTNTFRTPLYSRVPIHRDGSARGPVEVISSSSATPDESALDRHGNAWIATNPSNSLVKVTLESKTTVIAGGLNEMVLLGPTAAAFGRTSRDRDVLYISSTGGIFDPPPSGAEPARLYSIDTSKYVVNEGVDEEHVDL